MHLIRFAVSLYLLTISSLASCKPFVLVYADYKPFSYMDGRNVKGLEVEILTEALEQRMKLEIEHKILPWSRAQQYVKEGLADAFVATTNAERGSYSVLSKEPVARWEVSLFIRQGDARFTKIRKLEDVKDFEIGALIGNGWVKTTFPGSHIQFVDREELLPRMLQAARFDVVPENPYVMYNILDSDAAAGPFAEIPMVQLRQDMFLHVSQHSDLLKLLPRFDETLAAMRADGSLQRIENKYRGRK